MGKKQFFCGGVHECRIQFVKSYEQYFEIYVDICGKDDDFRGYFNKHALGSIDDWKKAGIYRIYYENKFKPGEFERIVDCIERSNEGFKFDKNDLTEMIGAKICCVWRKEEFKPKGTDDVALMYVIYNIRSVQDFRHGQVKPVDDYLRYSNPYKPQEEKKNNEQTYEEKQMKIQEALNLQRNELIQKESEKPIENDFSFYCEPEDIPF